jgi:hypothetical protein
MMLVVIVIFIALHVVPGIVRAKTFSTSPFADELAKLTTVLREDMQPTLGARTQLEWDQG